MNWEDYVFIYKDSHGKWNKTTNPRFIAEHTYCRAILKEHVGSGEYTIDEYDTGDIIIKTRDLGWLINAINDLREDGLSNYRISEWENISGEEVHILTMNLDEFDSIAYLGSII